MRKFQLTIWLLFPMIMFGQLFGTNDDRRDDIYLSALSNYAVNSNDNLILNFVTEAGVSYDKWDISMRYEYANLEQKYHSYSIGVGLILVDLKNWLLIPGVKGGLIHRDAFGVDMASMYYGIDVELRWILNRVIVGFEIDSDYRTDLGALWGEADWIESFRIKLGIVIN